MTWALDNLPQISALLVAHIAIALPAVALSILIAVPLGWFAHASPWGRATMLSTTGLLYAIPSLPLLIVVPLLTGLPLRSHATMVIALTVYGVAIMTRSAADAFAAVPRDARAAAVATGYSRLSRLLAVELPLASPVLVAGARVVAMSTVGLTTIGALIGVPGLGNLFTDGFQRGIGAEVATGVVLTLALAGVIDGALRGLGRATQPWTHTRPRHGITA